MVPKGTRESGSKAQVLNQLVPGLSGMRLLQIVMSGLLPLPLTPQPQGSSADMATNVFFGPGALATDRSVLESTPGPLPPLLGIFGPPELGLAKSSWTWCCWPLEKAPIPRFEAVLFKTSPIL